MRFILNACCKCDRIVSHCLDPWSWAEDELRRLESPNDSFEVWQKKVVKAVSNYPSKEKLVGSMARKVKQTLERKGGPIDD